VTLSKRLLPAAILGAVGGLATVFLLSTASFRIDGFTLVGGVSPATRGETVVSLPPFGAISARTHTLPVRLDVSLERVSLDKVRRLATEPVSKAALLATVQRDAEREGRNYLLRLGFLAVLGSVALTIAVYRLDAQKVATGALFALLTFALLVGVLIKQYDIKAFRQPRYHGALSSAPWLMDTLEQKMGDLKHFREQAKTLASGAYDFYRRVGSLPTAPERRGQVVLLHVGDIHNNPVGLDFTRRIAKDFNVDAVIDTGDITDFGTPLESTFLQRVAAVRLPYVFMGGNHDSPAVLGALRKLPNVRLINGRTITVRGITILGFADPASSTNATQASQSSTETRLLAKKYAAVYKRLSPEPDIVAVHEPRDGALLVGKAKVIISGHTHVAKLEKRGGTVIENVGTTGAAGIRGLGGKSRKLYTLQILRFARKPMRLVAVDTITIDALQNEFSVQRTTTLHR